VDTADAARNIGPGHRYLVGVGPAELLSKLHDAQTWWATISVLVEAWHRRVHPTGSPWVGDDDDFEQYGRLLVDIEHDLGPIEPGGPTAHQRDVLADALADNAHWRLAAVVEAIDQRCHEVFCADWLSAHPEPWVPAPGELYPVPSWVGPADWPYSRNPANFTNRPDEFPHVRVYAPDLGVTMPVEILFDPTAEAELDAALTEPEVLATIHPNDTWTDISMRHGPSAYPIVPTTDDQFERVQNAIATALAADAQLIVAPELCVTDEHIHQLTNWYLERGPFAVTVLGSCHTDDDGEPANVATTCIGTTVVTHRKIVPFTSDPAGATPTREGIRPGPRRLRVLAAARYRFATVICKDFLDADIRHVLARAGVNVLAVPTMSVAMDTYPAEVDEHVHDTQGIVAVANNPARRSDGARIQPGHVFGQPKRNFTHVAGPASEDPAAPNVAVFRIGDAATRCIPLTEMLD